MTRKGNLVRDHFQTKLDSASRNLLGCVETMALVHAMFIFMVDTTIELLYLITALLRSYVCWSQPEFFDFLKKKSETSIHSDILNVYLEPRLLGKENIYVGQMKWADFLNPFSVFKLFVISIRQQHLLQYFTIFLTPVEKEMGWIPGFFFHIFCLFFDIFW